MKPRQTDGESKAAIKEHRQQNCFNEAEAQPRMKAFPDAELAPLLNKTKTVAQSQDTSSHWLISSGDSDGL
jgi:hypothetical protein